jgi:hypothetical protein
MHSVLLLVRATYADAVAPVAGADNTNGYAEEYVQGFPLTMEDCECTPPTV